MECPSCGTENSVSAKFCSECGSQLGRTVCSNCGADLSPDAKFCSECGQRTDAPSADPVRDKLRQYIPDELLSRLESSGGSHMAGERRTVTMLFCDVEGSTAAAEDLDPEDWAEIINGAFEHLIQPVYEYEGTLARLMGDAILAFFGAPISHEDDPQRAVLAGLGILDGIRPYAEQVRARHGVDIGVRVGINTGLVVVGEMGSDLRLEYTAMGDAVNLASRMEQTAEAGTIQISEDTWRLVDPFFDTVELGLVDVKGKSEPVRTFRVSGEKADRGTLRGLVGLSSPMVGRDAELATLRDLVADLSTGRGAVASVMGEAGLGKSRLVRELHDELDAAGRLGSAEKDASGVRWQVGRSYSYETGRAFAPFIDLFETCFGIAPDDPPGERVEKVATAVAAIVGPDRAGDVRPYLLSLFGLPIDDADLDRVRFMAPPELRARVFDAVSEVVAALAGGHPLAIVLEDLHWADSASIDLAEHLMPLCDEAMLAIIAVFRPRREDPSWRFHETASRDHHHRYTPIELRPLDVSEGRDLVGNLLYIEGLTEDVRSLILGKAEGNPFFVEEVIRSLIDTGAVIHDGETWRATREIADVNVPDSLASLITTRLDRLDETTKLAAYTAAVIGREFDVDLLAAVMPDDIDLAAALRDLERRELVRETARLPVRRYRFKHVLTQETAYSSALNKTRRAIHRRLAEHLEHNDPDDARSLARHWLGAGESTRAVPHLVTAGEQAFASYSAPEAIRYFEQATELLGDDLDTEIGRRAWEGLAGARTFSADIDGANAAAEALIAFGKERADIPTQVAGLNKMGFASTLSGAEDRAFSCLEEATDLATEADDRAGLAEAHQTYCFLKTNRGELESALENQQQSQELGDALGAPLSRAFGLVHYANTLVYLTRYDEAKVAAEKARAFCEEAGLKQYLGEVLGHTEPFILIREGRFTDALELSREGVALVRETGASLELAMCVYTRGQCELQLGYLEEALESFSETRELGEATGMAFLTAAASAASASAHHALADDQMRIRSLHEVSNAGLDQPMGNAMASAALADMGFCALQLGSVDAASDYFDRGLRMESATSLLMLPVLRVGAGLVALRRGDLDRARRLIDDASDYAASRRMRHVEPLIGMARSQLLLAVGDTDAGLAELRDAEARASGMAMLPMVQMLAGARAAAAQEAGADDEARTAAFRRRETAGVLASRIGDEARRATFLEAASEAPPGHR